MRHYLSEAVIGHAPEIDIDQDRFDRLQDAMRLVIELVRMEEEWDILVGNAFSMERDLLEVALYDMMYSDHDWFEFNQIRVRFTRHLQNLMSSCRSYLDRTPQTLNRIDRSKQLSAFFKTLTHNAYDNVFGYRFMEALRNYAQHGGHPIHGTLFDARRIEHEHGTVWRYVAGATIDPKLFLGTDFKQTVAREAIELDIQLDAIHLAREYVEALNDIHVRTREEIISRNLLDPSEVDRAITDYTAASGDLLGLSVFTENDDGKDLRAFTVFKEPFDRLDRLRKKNGSLVNFSKRYASGELLVPRKPKHERTKVAD